MRGSAAFWALEWAIFFSLYLIFAFSLRPSELLAGALAAATATLAAEVVRAQPQFRMRFRRRWLTPLVRLPLDALLESLLAYRFLFAQLFRRRSSTLTAFTLHATSNDLALRGKRALAVAVVSSTPNSVVLGYDAEQDRLLLHQLYPADSAPILDAMGADPS